MAQVGARKFGKFCGRVRWRNGLRPPAPAGDSGAETLARLSEAEVIFSRDFVATEPGAAEITLTGVAEGHPA
jgi:hypothetical protein